MSVEFSGFIEVTDFQSQNSGERSPWTLRIKKQDKFAVFCLFWNDNDRPANVAFADLQKFKDLVASL